MYELLVLDLDDTLLTTDKQITETNRSALQACLARGMKVITASGRFSLSQMTFIKKIDLGIENEFNIGDGGGTIFNASGVIEKFGTFTEKAYRSVLAQARVLDIPCFVVSGDNVYYDVDGQPLQDIYQETPGTIRSYIKKIPDLGTLEAPLKFIFHMQNEADYLKVCQIDVPGTVTIKVARELIEITMMGMNKYNALAQVCALYEIPMENTVAIGDSENDIPMIKGAGLGLAMKNALDNVKAVADHVGEKTNDQNGVAQLIEHYIL